MNPNKNYPMSRKHYSEKTKEDKSYNIYLKELLELAKELNNEREAVIKPNKAENILIYVNENK